MRRRCPTAFHGLTDVGLNTKKKQERIGARAIPTICWSPLWSNPVWLQGSVHLIARAGLTLVEGGGGADREQSRRIVTSFSELIPDLSSLSYFGI